VSAPLPSLLLPSLLAVGGAFAASGQELAEAVRCYYDEGAEVASERLRTLLERSPGQDDVAWWLARCELELGDAASASEHLRGRGGQNVQGWRFPALGAQASLMLGDASTATERAYQALQGMDEGEQDSLARQTRALAAALAVRRGDEDTALQLLLAEPAEIEALPSELAALLPELGVVMALPLHGDATLPEPLLLQARGGWWSLPAGGGLARLSAAPSQSVAECDGPDLCLADGSPLMDAPGVRFTPVVAGRAVLYGAGWEPADEHPELAGLFGFSPRRGRVDRLTTAPEGCQDHSPAPGDEALHFLRRCGTTTRLMRLEPGEEPVALAPDLSAISALVRGGDRLLLVAVVEARSQLRVLPAQALPSQESEPLLVAALEVWGLGLP
jgi:hypothetical protein